MKKYTFLLLALTSASASAGNESETWQIDGIAHYIKSKETNRFGAHLVRVGRNSAIVAFSRSGFSCIEGGQAKRVKIQYQWVNFTRRCWGNEEHWIPKSQKGKDFVMARFSGNSDVKIIFGTNHYTFSTKKFTSTKQHWQRTLQNLDDAL